LIEAGDVRLNGRTARAAARVVAGDTVEIVLPPPAAPLQPEHIPLDVVYEDADAAVVNKAAGMVVHPAPGHSTGTLVNALLARYPEIEAAGEGEDGGEDEEAGPGAQLDRPGIVHRLDRDTSGLMVVAKHETARRFLVEEFRQRRPDKRYVALVDGVPSASTGTIDAAIGRSPKHPQQMAVVAVGAGGRDAMTHFRVVRRFARHTLLECKLVTGRTHQIRVHLAAINHPVVGDAVYGRRPPTLPLARQFLHSWRLTLTLPSGETRSFEAPLPADLQAVLDCLDA
jgi:23S rRNA pseudouridine1911/1915/1917 synthase